MRRLIVGIVVVLFAFTGVLADEIRIQGGGTSIVTVFTPIKSRFEKLYGHRLDIVQSSAVKALIALYEGKVDVASGAHPLEDLLAGAAREGVKIDATKLVATEVEDNRLIVVVNRANPVKALTKEQLKDVFTGKTTNWKEVGGRDAAIRIVWGKETVGQNLHFTRIALDGQAVTSSVREVNSYRDIAEEVAANPDAVGVVPMELASAATRTLETPVIKSPVYVITRGAPSAVVREMLDFYRAEYSFLKQEI